MKYFFPFSYEHLMVHIYLNEQCQVVELLAPLENDFLTIFPLQHSVQIGYSTLPIFGKSQIPN